MSRCIRLVFFDALRVKIREEGLVRNKAIYFGAGRPARRHTGHLGTVDREHRGCEVLDEGVQRPEGTFLIAVTDGLKGMPEALGAVFPATTCVSECRICTAANIWDAGPCREGTGMTGQEAVHTRIEEEAQIDLPRPRNHHKGHQRPARQSDLQVAKTSPVALTLFSWQGAKPKVRLGHRAWTMKQNQVSEVVMTAAVAPLIDYRIQVAGRE